MNNKNFLKKFLLFGCVLFLPLVSLVAISCSKPNSNSGSNNTTTPPSVVTPETTPTLNSNGGYIGRLLVDSYKEVIEPLGLTPETNLVNINNSYLNNKLSLTNDYSNLRLIIQNGSSQREGKLILQLSGKYYNKDVQTVNITITGFISFQNSLLVNNSSIVVDNQAWFENYNPIANSDIDFTNTSIQKNISLFKGMNFIFYGKDNSTFYITIQNLPTIFDVQRFELSKLQGNRVNIDITLRTKYWIYRGDQWTIDSTQDTIQSRPSQEISFSLPTLLELKEFLLSSFVINRTQMTNYYPSYFYGKHLYESSHDLQSEILSFIDYQTTLNKYKQTYFPTSTLYPKVSAIPVANDYNGTLGFTLTLIDDKNANDTSAQKTFNVNNLKSINAIANTTYNTSNFSVKSDSSFGKQVRTLYQTQIDTVIKTMGSYKTTIQQLPQDFANVYSYEQFNAEGSNYFQNFQNTFFNSSLSLFNKTITFKNTLANGVEMNSLNINNGLISLTSNNNDAFLIEAIQIDNTNSKQVLIEFDPFSNGVVVKISCKFSITLRGGQMLEENANVVIAYAS